MRISDWSSDVCSSDLLIRPLPPPSAGATVLSAALFLPVAFEFEHGILAALGHQAQSARDFLIGLDLAAEVAAEAVLVELFVRRHVPQAAAVGADLVGEADAAEIAFIQTPEFELEVDEADADRGEHARPEVVDADRHVLDVVELFLAAPVKAGDMLLGDERVAQRVVLVAIFDQGAGKLRPLLDAEALRQRARRDVAHDHFDRHDLDLPDQLLAHVEAADEVVRHADIAEQGEDMLRDPVVEHALAIDRPALLRVERGRVVLEILDQRARFGAFVKDLGFAFVDLAAAGHGQDFLSEPNE